MVTKFLSADRGLPCPCCPLKGYAADIHRGLQVGLRSRRRSLPMRKFEAPPLPTPSRRLELFHA